MTGAGPLVTILLATRNGAAFLEAQLVSILGQSHRNWRIHISDDGSTDATLAIAETLLRPLGPGRWTILSGPGRGASANFIHLLTQTGPGDGYIAFCDQDDIWLPEKLERAVRSIAAEGQPALYASAVILTDTADRALGASRLPHRQLGFSHALAENVLTGNTMVMNPAAAELVRRAAASCTDQTALESGFHDWFAYQVIAGAGGQVVFDQVPGLRYRQHAGNAVGSGQAPGRFWIRVRRFLGGEYGTALRRQAAALAACPTLPTAQRQQAERLLALRSLPIWQRSGAFQGLGLYRQSRVESLLLRFLALMGRI